MFKPMMTTTQESGSSTSIYLLAAHPRWRESRVNRRLLAAARTVAQVEVNDLYSSYPDYHIDIDAEQARVGRADLLVLLHPIQWYAMPALQKLWFDEVLTYGWAYGTDAKALRGKDLWLVATTGGPEASYQPGGYNRFSFDAFLPPYVQTAALCGMRFLPPLLLHGARTAPEAEVATHAQHFAERLSTYPAWRERDALPACAAGAVPDTDRPGDDQDNASRRAASAPTPSRAPAGAAPQSSTQAR